MAVVWMILAQLFCGHIAFGAEINVARGKPVGVSSRLSGRDPRIAVDGNTNAVNPNGVIHTALRRNYAWWWVDLRTNVQDPTVKIYFRTDYKYRRNGVRLNTSPAPFNYPGGQLCHTVTGRTDGTNIPDVVSVRCPGTWRYLMVSTNTNNDRQGPILDFGEVQVLVCSTGTYGTDCTQSCSSRQCSVTPTSCDRYTGACPPGGCQPKWTGTDCSDCETGLYGANCDNYCTSRQCAVTPVSCDKVTGACPPGGCQAGWQGTDCTQECPSNKYGVNCINYCVSRQCADSSSICHRVTGECVGGCRPGWRETDCSQACLSGTYGHGCNMSCGDRKCSGSSACDQVTGRCVWGCQPGWNGTDCTQKCPAGTYGNNCDKLCVNRHCLTSSDTCDHVTGFCPADGCLAGWKDIDCTGECNFGKYGANCENFCSNRKCKTLSSSCDRETGECPDGCQDGWTGEDCTSQCPTGTFGIICFNCSIRHCQGESDCPGDGTCSGGCQDGWTLDNCTQACPIGTYGPSCTSTCGNCSSGDTCNHVAGNCPGDCKAGWEGDLCKQTCQSKTYGVSCSETCGHCNGTCDSVDGHCPRGCEEGYNGTLCKIALQTGDPGTAGSSVGAAVGGTVAALLVIVIIIIGFIVYRRKQPSFSKDNKKTSTQSLVKPNGPATDKTDKEGGSVYVNVALAQEEGAAVKEKPPTREKPKLKLLTNTPQFESEEEVLDEDEPAINRDYYNDSADVIREIPVADLTDTVNKIKKREGGFEAEYVRLPTGFTAPYDDSQKPENVGKNKFRGYYPYDNNRIRLSLLPDTPGSDYINASLMHSYDQKKTYIAAQAPNKKTVGDFWRMIWEQRCGRVIMLTGLVEATKVKCFQYWPKDDTFETDHFQIKVEVTDIRANYTVRHLKVTSKEKGNCRTIVQYHYTTWPDHGIPDTLALVQFIWMVRRTKTPQDGPPLVHCSAGIGRTGTYIAIDSLLDQARNEGMVDVQGYVTAMRAERKNMIQTKEQYECVFHCLVEMTTFGNTSMDVENFTTSYSSRGMDGMVDRKTIRELTQMATKESRNGPPDRHRMWVDGNQDFIIRVGPTRRHVRGNLQAVAPPPGQHKLLWKLVEENNVHNVIIVSPLEKDLGGKKGTVMKYGDVTLTTMSQTSPSPDLIVLKLQLKMTNKPEETRHVTLFKFSGSLTMVSMSSHLLDHAHLQHLSAETTPVVLIHSEADRKCCVMLCVMSNILFGILEDRRVDVIGHVRTFLKCCPDITFTEQEIEKLHEFAQECVQKTDTSNTYANL